MQLVVHPKEYLHHLNTLFADFIFHCNIFICLAPLFWCCIPKFFLWFIQCSKVSFDYFVTFTIILPVSFIWIKFHTRIVSNLKLNSFSMVWIKDTILFLLRVLKNK